VRRGLPLAVALGSSLLLAGCTPIVTLTPAPQATAVGCAAVIVRLPDRIAVGAGKTGIALDERKTDAQGTAAWGEPVRVSLRCGVTSTPPSNQCVTFEKVDWKVQSATIDRTQRYVLTTYGRTPAVQVVLDAGLPSDQVMSPISDAVQVAIPGQSVRCTVAGNAPTTASPSSSASPTP
jgi:hypothetical protein